MIADSMSVSYHWRGNLLNKRVFLCGTRRRDHNLLPNALAQNNCCHLGNGGGPSQSVMVNMLPGLPLFYHLPHYMSASSCSFRPLESRDGSYSSYTSSTYHMLVSHRHSVNELVQVTCTETPLHLVSVDKN